MKYWALLSVLFLALASCATPVAETSQKYTLSIDGHDRTYYLHRPANLSPASPVPLVIMLHGGFGTGAQAEGFFDWDAEADRGSFAVAYPDGYVRSWHAGEGCCGLSLKDNINDLAFLTQVIQDASRHQAIDPKRVYMTGMSNGAAMAYYYACIGPFPIAAVGGVAGSFLMPCRPQRALSVMEIHGLDDGNIPYNGGKGTAGWADLNWLGVPKTLDLFAQAMHCTNLNETGRKGAAIAYQGSCDGGNEMGLITIAGAGHQWPGTDASRILFSWIWIDTPNQDINATSTLWQFFERHRAP